MPASSYTMVLSATSAVAGSSISATFAANGSIVGSALVIALYANPMGPTISRLATIGVAGSPSPDTITIQFPGPGTYSISCQHSGPQGIADPPPQVVTITAASGGTEPGNPSDVSFAKLVNGFSRKLAANRSAGGSVFVLDGPPGFTLTSPEWVRLTVVRGIGALETRLGHFMATGVSGSTLTGIQAIDGYPDVALLVGDRVEIRDSEETFADIHDAILDGLARPGTPGPPGVASATAPISYNPTSKNVSMIASPVAAGTYAYASITVDAFGRVLAATSNTAPVATNPGGSPGHIQYNDSGSFAGSADLAWTPSAKLLKVGNSSIHSTGPHSVFVGPNAGNTAINSAYGNNTAFGDNALNALTSGYYNTALGKDAGKSITSGDHVVAIGVFACQNVTTGSNIIGIGESACGSVTTGSYIVGIGPFVLPNVVNSSSMVGVGAYVFNAMTSGSNVVGVGTSVFGSTNGSNLVGIGAAIFSNSTASNNVAIGVYCGSGSAHTQSNCVIAIGYANFFNTASTDSFEGSVAIGHEASRLRSGQYGVSIGYRSGFNDGSTAITGDRCTLLGSFTNAGSTVVNSIALGSNALVSQSNACAIGGTGANSVDIGINSAAPASRVHAVADSPSKVGFVYQGADAQTADAFQVRSSSGSVLGALQADGSLKLASLADSAASNGSLYISTTGGNKLAFKGPTGTVVYLSS